MLTQMLQFDKAEEVREAVVHSLGQLVLFIADTNKYNEVCIYMYTVCSHSLWSNGSVLDHRSLPPIFQSQHGTI